MGISIRPTEKHDLKSVQRLWADGDVMKFVGFPDGLSEPMEALEKWYQWICENRPYVNHYSVFEDDLYCGETFYHIDIKHDWYSCLDIKLLRDARGKGIATKALHYAIEQAFLNGAKKVWVDPVPENKKAIALYERIGFVRAEMPKHLRDVEGENHIYMEKNGI